MPHAFALMWSAVVSFFFYDPLKAQHPNEDELSLGDITLLRIIFNNNILWSRQNAINWNVKKKNQKQQQLKNTKYYLKIKTINALSLFQFIFLM